MAKLNYYPGFEKLFDMPPRPANGERPQMPSWSKYEIPENIKVKDMLIPGVHEGQTIRLRLYRPEGCPSPAPVCVEIHGGGWMGGSLDGDDYRCCCLAKFTPCLVVSVEYRLTTREVYFPEPLLDCYQALNWVHDHAAEIDADPEKIALHGTSAGGNLVAGLALYVRDHGGPKIALAVINCAVLSMERGASALRYAGGGGGMNRELRDMPECIYIGGYNGQQASYYAMPAYCTNLAGLCPMMVIAAEFDGLRDESVDYAVKLMRAGVPCELIVAPRVGHGFCRLDHPLVDWIHKGIAASFRREFGMETVDF